VDLDRVTYADLLALLPQPINQIPQCEGQHKNRFLSDSKAVVADPKAFKLIPKWGEIEVQARSIHGVMVGTEFVVQDLNAMPSCRSDLGILVALDIDSSMLGHCPGDNKFNVPQGAKAVVSDWKNRDITLKVTVELEPDNQLKTVPHCIILHCSNSRTSRWHPIYRVYDYTCMDDIRF